MPRYYRRHLPHGAPENSAIFITFNLKGSLPQRALGQIKQLRKQFEKYGDDSNPARLELSKQIFRITEHFLDKAQDGPLYLQDPRCAEIVSNKIIEGAREYYDLFAFVVMANHVHLLLNPIVSLERITAGIKKSTARPINSLLHRTGQPFWQDKSFDHRPRDPDRFLRFLSYIESNPVKAGLCASPGKWPWSSAPMRSKWPKGTPFRA
ncbi:transposase [bacterium]|nr:transposase [bacterium]